MKWRRRQSLWAPRVFGGVGGLMLCVGSIGACEAVDRTYPTTAQSFGGNAGEGGSGGAVHSGGFGGMGMAGGNGAGGSATVGGMGGEGGGQMSGGGGIGGMVVPCAVAEDCPGVVKICEAKACENGMCRMVSIAANGIASSQFYGDCRVTFCDGMGGTSSMDDLLDSYDDGNQCTADYCDGGTTQHIFEATGTLCAQGYCNNQGACVECLANVHCISPTVCKSGKCVPPGCTNAIKDGTETDIDCGGSCLPCVDGKICVDAFDCGSKACSANMCVAPSCQDGNTNGFETGIDCGGGICAACGSGKVCKVAADCVSGVCIAAKCMAPTCSDGVKNGGEQGIDCGATCATCN